LLFIFIRLCDLHVVKQQQPMISMHKRKRALPREKGTISEYVFDQPRQIFVA